MTEGFAGVDFTAAGLVDTGGATGGFVVTTAGGLGDGGGGLTGGGGGGLTGGGGGGLTGGAGGGLTGAGRAYENFTSEISPHFRQI